MYFIGCKSKKKKNKHKLFPEKISHFLQKLSLFDKKVLKTS